MTTQATAFTLQRLAPLLAVAKERAALSGTSVMASLAQPLDWTPSPLQTFAAGMGREAQRRFWARPSDDFWMVGLGQAWVPPSFAMQRAWRALQAEAVVEAPARQGVGPVLLSGLPFDAEASPDPAWRNFGASAVLLPRLLFTWQGKQCWLTVNVLVGRRTDAEHETAKIAMAVEELSQGTYVSLRQPPSKMLAETSPADWQVRMEAALAAVRSGKVSKVVLARRKTLYAPVPFSVEAALDSLTNAYPGCAVFALDQGHACFLGASPESLVRLEHGQVRLRCMAGTVVRGATPQDDESLACQLLASEKDRREHAAVVLQVAEGLQCLCDGLVWDEQPQVVRLKTLQHLATAFQGHAREGKDILDMAAALHPTPAVGGTPKAAAISLVRKLEGDRGWYAGPVGWLDAQGDGEFWVGIRSALVRGNQATLYAGAGIVAGSQSEQEYQETEWKFQPMFKALSPGD